MNHVFNMCQSSKWLSTPRPDLYIGPAKETPQWSAAELKRLGIIGVYRAEPGEVPPPGMVAASLPGAVRDAVLDSEAMGGVQALLMAWYLKGRRHDRQALHGRRGV